MGAIHLIRHGQASWESDDYDQLSELGYKQAGWLGQSWESSGFEPTWSVAGSLKRHAQTAVGVIDAIDGDLYDGDPPNLWSEIPDYYYDDVAAIAQTLDGDDGSDDADTAEEDDDSEVFYRDIDDPPPIGVSVLLLYKGYPKPFIGSSIESLIDGEYEYVDDCGSSEPPIFWSYLPKLPALDS